MKKFLLSFTKEMSESDDDVTYSYEPPFTPEEEQEMNRYASLGEKEALEMLNKRLQRTVITLSQERADSVLAYLERSKKFQKECDESWEKHAPEFNKEKN